MAGARLWEAAPQGLSVWSLGPSHGPGGHAPCPALTSPGEQGLSHFEKPEPSPETPCRPRSLAAVSPRSAPGSAGLTCPGSGRNLSSPGTRIPSQVQTGQLRTHVSESAPATRETAVRTMARQGAPASRGAGEGGWSCPRPPSSAQLSRSIPWSPTDNQKRALQWEPAQWAGVCKWGAHRLPVSHHLPSCYQTHGGWRESSVTGLI